MPRLRDGSEVRNGARDRLYELDWNSLNYPVTEHPEFIRKDAIAKPPRSYTWSIDTWLDQGQEGACVGFGCTHELRARPRVVNGVSNAYAREKVYWEAQKIDPWPGGSYPGASPRYEGTAVLSGMKVLKNLGFYSGYYWALNIEQLVMGIAYAGPCVLGLNWYEGMDETDANGYIKPTGEMVGGHCIMAMGVRIVWKAGATTRTWADVDLDRSYVTLHNSWGKDWGQMGRAKISVRDLDRLLNEDGDAAFPYRTDKIAA